MISPEFYSDKGRISQVFLGGFRKHFVHKERTVVIGSYTYVLQYGETIFDLTEKVFGKGNTRYWTVIADMNRLTPVDTWEAGMEIELPEKVVFDSELLKRKFL